MEITILFATLHHWLAFTVTALLAAELVLLRPGVTEGTLRLLARIDKYYGITFGILVAIGLARVIWFEKGWEYYLSNQFFHLKMTALVLITLLSVPPTIRFIRWQRAGRLPGPAEITATRRLMWAQVALMPVMGFAAAAMARGF